MDVLGFSGTAVPMWCVVCELQYKEVQAVCSLHSPDFPLFLQEEHCWMKAEPRTLSQVSEESWISL